MGYSQFRIGPAIGRISVRKPAGKSRRMPVLSERRTRFAFPIRRRHHLLQGSHVLTRDKSDRDGQAITYYSLVLPAVRSVAVKRRSP